MVYAAFDRSQPERAIVEDFFTQGTEEEKEEEELFEFRLVPIMRLALSTFEALAQQATELRKLSFRHPTHAPRQDVFFKSCLFLTRSKSVRTASSPWLWAPSGGPGLRLEGGFYGNSMLQLR